MKKNNRRGLRKRRKAVGPNDPLIKLEQLTQSLSRYIDYDAGKFLKGYAESLDGIPKLFSAKAESWTCCAVSVNWDKVKAALVAMAQGYCESRNGRPLTQEELERVTNRIGEEHLIHVVENLPVALDSALTRLCFEALVVRADPQNVRGLTKLAVESLLRVEERKTKKRLGVRQGPREGTKRATADVVGRDTKRLKRIKTAVLKLYGPGDSNDQIFRKPVANEIGVSAPTLRKWLEEGEWDFEDLVACILRGKC